MTRSQSMLGQCCRSDLIRFCGGAQTLRVPVSTTEQEEVQVQVTRVLVESYFDLVRKSLQDAVPKARIAPRPSLVVLMLDI